MRRARSCIGLARPLAANLLLVACSGASPDSSVDGCSDCAVRLEAVVALGSEADSLLLSPQARLVLSSRSTFVAAPTFAAPFSANARLEAGLLLRRLQRGERLGLPRARSMSSIGRRCVELRVPDGEHTWRIICRVDPDAVIVVEVFSKKTQQTPQHVIEASRRRLRDYDRIVGGSNG